MFNKTHKVKIGKVKLLKSNNPVSIEDLLAKDDVNGILKDLDNIKPDIKHLITIWVDQNDTCYFEISDDTPISSATWMLESTKFDLLKEASE